MKWVLGVVAILLGVLVVAALALTGAVMEAPGAAILAVDEFIAVATDAEGPVAEIGVDIARAASEWADVVCGYCGDLANQHRYASGTGLRDDRRIFPSWGRAPIANDLSAEARDLELGAPGV